MKEKNKIDNISEAIKIIEKQIKDFEKKRPLFFQKKKLKIYNARIEKLEESKRFLYKSIEHYFDNK